MRILVDARKLGDGGIGVYIENLVDGLLALKDKRRIDLSLSLLLSDAFFESDNQSAVSTHYRTHGLGALFQAAKLRWFEKVNYIREPAPRYSLREYFLLPMRQRKVLMEHDLFHSPHYTLPYFLGIPSVVTIHDVIHLSHPEKFYHRPMARPMIRSALSRANHVITVSEYSARHIQKLARGLDTPVSVVPNALRPELYRRSPEEVEQYRKREFINREYCVYVGNERPHKGFGDLLDAWSILRNHCTLERVPDLIVVGKRFVQSRDKVHDLNLDGHIRFFGEVSLARLAVLYSGASAVIVPSRVEGFGLPALEAMGIGVPVICSPIPSLREVCEDAAFYAERMSGEAYAEKICEALSNPEVAGKKVKIGLERAASFSVEECALKTYQVYRSVLGQAPARGQEPASELDRDLDISLALLSGGREGARVKARARD